jgi:signal peptidase I
VVVVGALVVAIVIKTFLFQAFYIPSPSMEPTLKVGDRVLVNKMSYKLHDVHRGDIVVFERPSTDPQTVQACDGTTVTLTPQKNVEEVHDLIKRVVAVGGETVEVRAGHVFVNGEQLTEPYLPVGVTTPPFETAAFPTQCIRVPQGDVFVLGDNRTNSAASNRFGPIPESLIVGRAFIRVWPLGSLGGI